MNAERLRAQNLSQNPSQNLSQKVSRKVFQEVRLAEAEALEAKVLAARKAAEAVAAMAVKNASIEILAELKNMKAAWQSAAKKQNRTSTEGRVGSKS